MWIKGGGVCNCGWGDIIIVLLFLIWIFMGGDMVGFFGVFCKLLILFEVFYSGICNEKFLIDKVLF